MAVVKRVDALGLAAVPGVLPALVEGLAGWSLAGTTHAEVSPRTTTEAFWRQLAEAGAWAQDPVEKVAAFDELPHQPRFLPFDDLCRIASAEVVVALRGLGKRLDPLRSVLVFADHGFRISADGRSFLHGGPSTLERVVPLLAFAPQSSLGTSRHA